MMKLNESSTDTTALVRAASPSSTSEQPTGVPSSLVKSTYNMLDLFCGTGALSYGLETASQRLRTVGGIDADQAAARTAALNHPNAKIRCARIETILPEEMLALSGVGTIDVIVGGPPCQGFSSLRPSRGAGLDDPRNSLYMEFVKYVHRLRPRVFLLENVVGMLTAGEGILVAEMLAGFQRAGYEVEWRILNAANFGIPQKRERFFLLGVRKSLGARVLPEFPVPTHRFAGKVIGTRMKDRYVVNQNSGLPPVTVWDAISDLPTLKSGESCTSYRTVALNSYQAARRRDNSSVLTLHQAASHNTKMLEVIKHAGSSIHALPKGLVSSGYSSCYSRLASDEPSTTITVKFTSPASSKCIHPIDDRAITPREAARLQSFDDSFLFAGSKTDIASQIGNAVPPLFGEAFAPIIERLLDAQGIGEY
ncbi:DNA cytosine methyltransferase [Janthinobacterium sp. SUN118]|uniref:DNA cytosine methyltransferase n=1 Tax=Janthinobacterium sp. SUN118 TaxID=3004100 RepID=UPI0025AF5B1F|nr:DNA cytosine methyltransferase [Janthinobacterium sp. SUN118]MDN2713220.1 DNA cytosine methyltransferase [Janthinobacterium sp. SUN118]